MSTISNAASTIIFLESLKTGNLILIRALIYSQGPNKCTDGDVAETVASHLGNEILLKYPAKLIQALSEEKRMDLYAMVELENKDWFAVECDNDKCKSERKKFFSQKRTALTNAKIQKSLEPIRNSLLQHLKNDL